MQYTVKEIAELTGGDIYFQNNRDIRYLAIDSRTILVPEYSLFFAIKGLRNDGHDYVEQLYSKGVRCFVIEEVRNGYNALKNACFVVVEDSIAALQLITSMHRKRFDYPVIGITGSNGKTIVKEWLSQMMAVDKAVVKSPKSFNSQVGVPLSVWRMSDSDDIAIFEAGISMPGEMENLEKIIRPTIGILTNLGIAHSENFTDNEEKLHEKLLLFKGVEKLVYCRDNEFLDNYITNEFPRDNLFTWSECKHSDVMVGSKKEVGDTYIVNIEYDMQAFQVKLPFGDRASFENCMHCLTTLLFLGYDIDYIAESILKLHPVAMRLEIKEGINNCSIINDYYNSDPVSLGIALDMLERQSAGKKKTVILSDLLQTGYKPENLYGDVAALLNIKRINKIIGIGECISKYASLFDMERVFYPNTSSFIRDLSRKDFKNEAILLRGARDFHFEEISNLLQKKAHRTVLEVDLDAVVNNLNYYRSLLKPETNIMVMVKAFSYGSGLVDISRILQYNRVNYLGVAIADEGIELRNAGINIPIIVMNPEEYSFDSMIEYNLEPEIYNFEQLNSFGKALQRNGVDRYPIHIKIDSGMKRLGFTSVDVPELKKVLVNNNLFFVRSVFSHLAASDESVHDDFTKQQINIFSKCSSEIVSWFEHKVIRHILNSAGIERFAEYQFDMVRLGIGLYGVSSFSGDKIKNVSTLKTTISQIREIEASETVGYGRKGVVYRVSRIATIPVGYADGFDRRLGNGVGKVIINGKFAPVIGNVCMDMTMIDITGIEAKEGDVVIIFGKDNPVSDLAEKMGTIPYEVLTSVSDRVKRIYISE